MKKLTKLPRNTLEDGTETDLKAWAQAHPGWTLVFSAVYRTELIKDLHVYMPYTHCDVYEMSPGLTKANYWRFEKV